MNAVLMAEGEPKNIGRLRGRARRHAVQALYQWQLTGDDPAVIEVQFAGDWEVSQAERPYFQELLREVPARSGELDDQLRPFLESRTIEEVDPVERAILRIGAYELAARPDIPCRVIINEAVDLAKRFGAEQSHKFVNGVLDKAARALRAAEMAPRA